MPNIKPISDLRNYSRVLEEVNTGEPVFLTKNGRGRYALMDINDYQKLRSTLDLMSALTKGEESAKADKWLSLEEIEKALEV